MTMMRMRNSIGVQGEEEKIRHQEDVPQPPRHRDDREPDVEGVRLSDNKEHEHFRWRSRSKLGLCSPNFRRTDATTERRRSTRPSAVRCSTYFDLLCARMSLAPFALTTLIASGLNTNCTIGQHDRNFTEDSRAQQTGTRRRSRQTVRMRARGGHATTQGETGITPRGINRTMRGDKLTRRSVKPHPRRGDGVGHVRERIERHFLHFFSSTYE